MLLTRVTLPTRRLIIGICLLFSSLGMTATQQANAIATNDQEIVVGISGTFPGFCVGNSITEDLRSVTKTMLEPLVELDVDGRFIPFLASSLVPDSQFMNWTISIRGGIQFHDGTTLDAAAVALNINVWKGKTFVSDASFTTVGKGYASIRVNRLSVINTVEILDNSRLIVHLSRSTNNLPELLYQNGSGWIVAPAQIWNPQTQLANIAPNQSDATKTCGKLPIGTGPFVFQSFDTEHLVVVKNNNYWRTDPSSGQPLPRLQKISFVRQTREVRAAALNTGDVDLAVFSSVRDNQVLREIRSQGVFNEYKTQDLEHHPIFLNEKYVGSPFLNVHARKAVCSATDVETLNQTSYRGMNSTPKSMAPPSSVMFTTAGFCTYNRATAISEVAAYKSDTGLDLTVVFGVSTDSVDYEQYLALKAMWESVGIIVNTYQAEQAVIVAQQFGGPTNKLQASTGSFLSSVSPTSSSDFFRSDALIDDVQNDSSLTLRTAYRYIMNISNHRNSLVDSELFAARSSNGLGDRATHYRSAVEEFQTQNYAIPITDGFESWFAKTTIGQVVGQSFFQGIREPNLPYGGPDWSQVFETSETQNPPVLIGAIPSQVISRVVTRPSSLSRIGQNHVLVGSMAEGLIKKLNLTTGTSQILVPNAGEVDAIATTPDGVSAFFTARGTNNLFRISLGTGEVAQVGTVGNGEHSLAISSDGAWLVVGNSISENIIKYSLDSITQRAIFFSVDDPTGMTIDPSNNFIYVANSSTGTISKLSMANGNVVSSVLIGGQPIDIQMSKNGSFIFVTNQSDDSLVILRASDLSVVRRVKMSSQPGSIISGDGNNQLLVVSEFEGTISSYSIGLPPEGVSGLAVEYPASNTAKISYVIGQDNGDPITGIEYQIDSGQWTQVPNVATSFEVNNLQNGQTYLVRVRVKNASGASIESPSLSVSATPRESQTVVPNVDSATSSIPNATSSKSPLLATNQTSQVLIKTPKPPADGASYVRVSVSSSRLFFDLMTPAQSKKKIAKYVVKISPIGAGKSVVKTVTAVQGGSTKLSIAGTKKQTYSIQITAIPKSGKQITWSSGRVKVSG